MRELLCFFFHLQPPATSPFSTFFRTIYEKLSAALSEDEAAIYAQKMAEIVPSLRYCAYNSSGDAGSKQELLNSLRGSGLDELISQTREEQAATLQVRLILLIQGLHVPWRAPPGNPADGVVPLLAKRTSKKLCFCLGEGTIVSGLGKKGKDGFRKY